MATASGCAKAQPRIRDASEGAPFDGGISAKVQFSLRFAMNTGRADSGVNTRKPVWRDRPTMGIAQRQDTAVRLLTNMSGASAIHVQQPGFRGTHPIGRSEMRGAMSALWVAMRPFELAEPDSQYLGISDFRFAKTARVIAGEYNGVKSIVRTRTCDQTVMSDVFERGKRRTA
jgi:hypothetical protein